jgi:hypothetical protein
MQSFMKQLLFISFVLCLLLPYQPGMAEEWDLEEKPWEKFGANFGVFLSTVDSSFRIGSGIGLDIDVEDLLGLDTTNSVFRTDAMWRLTKNRRHRLDFTWFSLKRDGQRRILDDIVIEDDEGNKIDIPAGTTLEAFFDLDIYEIGYSYSFIQNDRLDLAAGVGLYVMPMDFGIKVSGLSMIKGMPISPVPCWSFVRRWSTIPGNMWASDWGLTPFLPNWRQRVRTGQESISRAM